MKKSLFGRDITGQIKEKTFLKHFNATKEEHRSNFFSIYQLEILIDRKIPNEPWEIPFLNNLDQNFRILFVNIGSKYYLRLFPPFEYYVIGPIWIWLGDFKSIRYER